MTREQYIKMAIEEHTERPKFTEQRSRTDASVDVEVALRGAGTIELEDCYIKTDEHIMQIITADNNIHYIIPVSGVLFARCERHNA